MAFSQAREDFLKTSRFRTTDKQYLAGDDVVDTAVALDDERASADFFSAHRFVEIISVRVAAEDPDDQRRVFIRELFGRPDHELREIEQEYGFDLIFASRRRKREPRRQSRQ